MYTFLDIINVNRTFHYENQCVKEIDYKKGWGNVHECFLRIKFFDLLNQHFLLYTLRMGGGSEKKRLYTCENVDTVFYLITAPALTTPPPLTFYFIFTYYRPLDDLFPDFLLYFHLLSPTWRSFGTSGREQIYVSALGAY